MKQILIGKTWKKKQILPLVINNISVNLYFARETVYS